ncbi:histidine kinase [Actinoplanes sp. NPDC049802]|uniref:sensor histidine kinase n=1 Tax=Actinoplanes sp. NPDC049802 TaxID=3154742 RepID=UPI0033E25234
MSQHVEPSRMDLSQDLIYRSLHIRFEDVRYYRFTRVVPINRSSSLRSVLCRMNSGPKGRAVHLYFGTNSGRSACGSTALRGFEQAVADDSREGAELARSTLASLIEHERAEILAAYMRALESANSTVAGDPTARAQTIAHAGQTLTDITRSLRAGRVLIDGGSTMLAWDIGETRASQAIPTRESWQAATVFAETVVQWMTHRLDAGALETFGIVMLTLNQSITIRIREATGAYTGYLLNRIHEAHLGERHRIARELHDRVSEGLSVAHRRLELFQDYREKDPLKAAAQAGKAQEAVLGSLESLRGVIKDLRLEAPLKSLEKALAGYIDSVPTGDHQLRLKVNGDETWLPTTVREESFLIIREAIRNSLTHGAAGVTLIQVDIAPHELRAVIEDTGGGFDPSGVPASSTAGLSSMRERAALLGGIMSVVSQPGHGTQVELTVPLQTPHADCD